MPSTNATHPVNILVIGKDPGILKVVLRLLNDYRPGSAQPPAPHSLAGQPGSIRPFTCHAIGSTDPDEARSLFADADIDLVLLTNGLDATLDASLRDEFLSRRPGTRILQHFGGGSGLLFAEIAQALNKP
ncbi:MAG TPA: hypothetical protein VMH27_22655 [Puia sp.]|nr:hypothetical protein [Puia sp.]